MLSLGLLGLLGLHVHMRSHLQQLWSQAQISLHQGLQLPGAYLRLPPQVPS